MAYIAFLYGRIPPYKPPYNPEKAKNQNKYKENTQKAKPRITGGKSSTSMLGKYTLACIRRKILKDLKTKN